MAKKDLKLKSEAFHHSYSLSENGGKMLEGWEAKHLGGKQFQIKRKDGSTKKITLGESLGAAGTVSDESNGVLRVGDYILPIGENFIEGWHAKKTKRSSEYIVLKKEGGSFYTKVGAFVEGMGKVSETPSGHLSIGNQQVQVYTQEYSLNLLVMDEKDGGGYVAWINKKLPNSEGQNGIKGVFFPKKDNQPAKFCETDSTGTFFITAKFWVTKDNTRKIVRTQLRDLETAIEERASYKELKKLEELAAESGAPKEMIPGYDELSKKVSEFNKDSWDTKIFHVASGMEDFGIKQKEPEYDTPSP